MKREWLVDLRNEEGLTQAEMAKKIGISRPYYTQIETGVKSPTGQTALRIATILDIDMRNFFAPSVDMVNTEMKNA